MAAGRKTGGGSRKGRPNRLTADVKEMILTALNKAGGAEYLLEQAEKNPVAFMSLLGKVLPLQVTGEGGGPILLEQIAEAAMREVMVEREGRVIEHHPTSGTVN
jgi:hypothetical protein